MSSLFNRQPEMLEAKKKRVLATRNANDADEHAPTPVPTDIGEHEGTEDSVPESWVELAPSRGSIYSSMEAVNIDEECSNRDSCLSPISLQSPCMELECNMEQVKFRLAKGNYQKNTDWIWDWSSRPEALPFIKVDTKFLTRLDPIQQNEVVGANLNLTQITRPYTHTHTKLGTSTAGSGVQSLHPHQITSSLTTPPNSPEPDLLTRSAGGYFEFGSPTRPNGNKKPSLLSRLLRFEVIIGFVVSNIVTIVIAGTVGYYFGKRVQQRQDIFSISNFHRW